MDNLTSTDLFKVLVIFAIQILAVLWIRKKYPQNIKAGCLVCLIAPGIGQFYIETKMSVVFFILIYGVVWNPLSSFISNSYVHYFATGCVSSGFMYVRLAKKTITPTVPTGATSNSSILYKCVDCNKTIRETDLINDALLCPACRGRVEQI